jgi:hypothetical protein
MRRRTSLSLALILGFVTVLGSAPAVLGQEADWSHIKVTCGDQETPCDTVDGYQTYFVDMESEAYFPEVTYNETMAVRVISGTLAFRVGPGSDDVMVEHTGNGIPILVTDIEVPFGQLTDPSPIPIFTNTETVLNAEQCSQPPLSKLCRLDPSLFENTKTFVQLGETDIVYLPANSMCFVCNISNNQNAQLEIWAPGVSGTTWFDAVQSMLGPSPTRLQNQQLPGVLGWMFNPGSPCH